MGSEVAAALVGAGGAVVGAAVGAVATLRAVLPYRQQAALQRSASLATRRYDSFTLVVAWMQPYLDDHGKAQEVPVETREKDARRLRGWYYQEGGALLMSGDSFNAYRTAVEALLEAKSDAESVSDALSRLRTELKTDIGSREPQERGISFAPSGERSY